MKFRPLGDRVLVKRTEAEETTKGGIIIPDNAKEKPMQAQVVAVGPGKTLDNGTVAKLQVNVGQTVFFRKYAGSEMNIEGQEHLILREDEILAVLE
jgi:chaperonin GroES